MKKSIFCLIIFIAAFHQVFAQTQKKPIQKPLTITGLSTAQNPKTTDQNLTPEAKRRLETFRVVWQTIKDNYFDQTFNGQNWDSIKIEFEPRILKSSSDKETYNILQEMINRLNRSHFAVIPPEVFSEIKKARAESRIKEKRQFSNKKVNQDEHQEISDSDLEALDLEDDSLAKYGIGIDLRLINSQFVITNIEKDSAADKNGLKTGYIIEKVNDVSLQTLLEKIQILSPNIRDAKKLLPLEIVNWFLNGEKDTSVNLTYFDENEQEKIISVPRQKLSGENISIGENLPDQFLNFETKALNDDVGYVKFNVFAMPVIAKFCAALTEFKEKKALIIDLRGNIGGLIGVLYGVSGMLSEQPLDLGTQIYKVGSEQMFSRPKAKNFKGNIVILIDNLSISAAEILTAAMQENRRAIVIGDKSAGEALPALSMKLPTNAVLVYPIANFKTHNGNFLEGKGVVPDLQVSLDRKSLLQGEDIQLESALKTIKENSLFPKQRAADTAFVSPVSPTNPPPPLAKSTPAPAVKAVIPPKVKPEKNIKDEKSLQVIADFLNAAGGAENLKKVESYILKGRTEMNIKTSKFPAEISIYLQLPDKYTEIMKSPVLGEIREVHNGNNFLVQSDFGISQEFPFSPKLSEIELLSAINNLAKNDYFKSLSYKGIFDSQGRKVNLIQAETSENSTVAMAFDVETKMLVSFASPTGTLLLGDYKKVENLLLPFSITRKYQMTIQLDEIILNPKIEETNFTKKENCFDKAN